MRIYAAREQHDKRHNYGGDYRIVIDVNCEIDNAKECQGYNESDTRNASTVKKYQDTYRSSFDNKSQYQAGKIDPPVPWNEISKQLKGRICHPDHGL